MLLSCIILFQRVWDLGDLGGRLWPHDAMFGNNSAGSQFPVLCCAVLCCAAAGGGCGSQQGQADRVCGADHPHRCVGLRYMTYVLAVQCKIYYSVLLHTRACPMVCLVVPHVAHVLVNCPLDLTPSPSYRIYSPSLLSTCSSPAHSPSLYSPFLLIPFHLHNLYMFCDYLQSMTSSCSRP